MTWQLTERRKKGRPKNDWQFSIKKAMSATNLNEKQKETK